MVPVAFIEGKDFYHVKYRTDESKEYISAIIVGSQVKEVKFEKMGSETDEASLLTKEDMGSNFKSAEYADIRDSKTNLIE